MKLGIHVLKGHSNVWFLAGSVPSVLKYSESELLLPFSHRTRPKTWESKLSLKNDLVDFLVKDFINTTPDATMKEINLLKFRLQGLELNDLCLLISQCEGDHT